MPVRFALFVLLCVLASPSAAAGDGAIAAILARSEPPPGVVFELIDSDPAALSELIPRVRKHVEALRARFPGLPVAVVSHGPEQFALTRDRVHEAPELHRAVRELTREQDVPVHVCGTFAEWRGVHAEDFPDYVDVAPAGPAQIRNYEDLGYLRVEL